MRVTRNNGTTEAKVEPAILAYSFPLAGSLHWIGQKRKAMSRKDREKKPHDAEQSEAEMRNAGAETPEGACNATDAPHAEGEAAACDNVADDTENGQPTPLEAALSEIEEWKDKYLRLSAEFDNYRKRTLREKADMVTTAAGKTIEQLLPVVDNFELALKSAESTESVEAMRDGLTLILKSLQGFLKSSGVSEIEAIGKPLDTDYHDAVTKIAAPNAELKGKIVDVIRKGYLLNGTVLRHAQVVVGE